jgi:hypothetical protein
MTPDPYQRVALRRDLDEHRLKAGDVAVLIDRAPHLSGGEGGVVLEVFNALGASIAVVTAPSQPSNPCGRTKCWLSARSPR